MEERQSVILLIIFGFLAGSAFLVTDLVKHAAPPITLVALRLTISFITLSLGLAPAKVWAHTARPELNWRLTSAVPSPTRRYTVRFAFDTLVLTLLNQERR